jgi:signal transduction histidine kinase
VAKEAVWRRPAAYALALAGAAVAVGLTAGLGPILDQGRYLLPFVAIVAAAAYGGILPALAAAVLAFVGIEHFLYRTDIRQGLALAVVYRAALFGAAVAAAATLVVRLRRSALMAAAEARSTQALVRGLEAEAQRSAENAAQAEGLARQLEDLNERLVATNLDVERAASRARRIQNVTATLLRSITPAQVADAVVAQGIGALDGEAGLLSLLTPDGRSVRLASASGFATAALERWRMLSLDSPLPLAVAVRTCEQVWMPSVSDDGDHFPLPDRNGGGGTRAWIVLPLVLRERAIGALALALRTPVDFSDDDRTFLALLGQQCAQALERARLYEAERNARVRAEFAERRLSFLAEASTRLASSLDYEATLVNVAQLIVPDLADWCAIHVLDDDGAASLLALVHRDRAKTSVLRTMETRWPSDRSPGGVRDVLATGKSELLTELGAATLRGRAQDDEHLALLKQLAPRSEISVAIQARDRIFGAITMVTGDSGRRYTTTDLSLAEELAARVGQAIDNAELYETTRLASQAKSDFLAIMSHELRTPLNAILGYADLVLLGVPEPVGEQAHHQVERVRTAAQHLLQLVDEVLSYARLESGKEVVKLEPIELGAVVRETMTLVAPLAERKGITLASRTTEDIRLETDGWKVRQILNNLLSNAVKFTEEGGWIGVTAAVDGKVAHIAVEDTGIGIPEEHLSRIFDPFWQVEHSSTRRFGGTGLGLGVARELARLLGGDVTVSSRMGSGSTFTLTLPMTPPRTLRAADEDPFAETDPPSED